MLLRDPREKVFDQSIERKSRKGDCSIQLARCRNL